jgi:hypothetical protein
MTQEELRPENVYQGSFDDAKAALKDLTAHGLSQLNEPWDSEGKIPTEELRTEANVLFNNPILVTAGQREQLARWDARPRKDGIGFSKRYVKKLERLYKLRQEAE